MQVRTFVICVRTFVLVICENVTCVHVFVHVREYLVHPMTEWTTTFEMFTSHAQLFSHVQHYQVTDFMKLNIKLNC